MIKVYYLLVKKGIKDIEDVPENIREAVRKMIEDDEDTVD